MARRQAREAAMMLVFEWSSGGTGRRETIEGMMDEYALTEDDKSYALEILDGVTEHYEDIDEKIRKYAKGWRIERMPKVDLSILRVAVFELLFRKDIPVGVSANEAVEMAKNFSGGKSPPFINGVLGTLICDLGLE